MMLNPKYLAAIQDFRRLRRRASLRKVFDFLNHSSGLLSYEDVRKQLRAIEMGSVKAREIPVNAIQGSVGRYTDFTRDFLPTESVDEQRWARVKTQYNSLEGVPPIEVYKIGEVYFVLDGNHRVSVAREMGILNIDAYVREVKSKVPLQINENLDQLLIKAELSEFLEETHFDQLYPHVEVKVTVPGRYLNLLQQIEAIHFAMELEENRSVPYEQAVKRWYDTVYYPLVELIRSKNILQDFPERTETDLFLWVFKHRAALAESLGWEITADSAIKDLSQQSDSKIKRWYDRSRGWFHKVIHSGQIESGPPPGSWRQEKMATPQGRLFGDLLVMIDGTERGWAALSQALEIAKLEGSQLFGLYASNDKIAINKQRAIQNKFEQRCKSNNTSGQITFTVSPPAQTISERACWADLVITSKFGESRGEIQTLIHNCPIPVLVISQTIPHIQRALLAYDGSPKSEEALFLAAYLATFWELSLTVITIQEPGHKHITPDTIAHARENLDYYGVPARYIETDQEPVNSILQIAKVIDSDLILLGGYGGYSRNRSDFSLLDGVMANAKQAIMICR